MCRAQDTAALGDELAQIRVSPVFVSDLTDVAAAAADAPPTLLLVDPSLGVRDESLLVAAFASVPAALRVLLLTATSGPQMSLAHRVGADAVVPLPLQAAVVGRLRTECDARDAPSHAATIALPELVDRSGRMRDVWGLVARASRTDASIVVTGETGVGKEAVARALHRFSRRRHRPFVAVNCAALPETLLESELFGHERGAFTGATGRRKGRFELADGGTLFLDEVGDLPLSLQVKLLRVLQEQRFERLGGRDTVEVDVRVVCATHRELEEAVRRGQFRADLYYRIRVLGIHVPPLDLRKDDILPLWDHFIETGAKREGRNPPETTMAARRRLLQHRWPGNVRELQNAAAHALMIVGNGPILPADLPDTLGHRAPEHTSSLAGMTLKQIERLAILDTYAAMGTVKGAAEALGVSERKLHYRLKHYRQSESTTTRLRAGGTGRRSAAKEGTTRGPALAPEILLAEDDDELRWSLDEFLRCAGYRVVAVRDGRAILEHLGASVLLEQGRTLPDAIVTDIRMPHLTGIELLERVRERGWQTPVVVISAFGDEELRNRASSMGAAAFLDKPIDTDALLRVLRSVVAH